MSTSLLDTCLTMRAATGWNVHRTNTTVAWPRQFELLSALWVIPRKRTLGQNVGTISSAKASRALAAAQASLKKRLQGSSLLLLSGEEAEVGTMGAGGPSIFRTFRAPIQREGSAGEESSRKEAGSRGQLSVRQEKKGITRLTAQQNKSEPAKAGRRTHPG